MCLAVSNSCASFANPLADGCSISLGQPHTDKARYNPGQQVVISLTVTNGTASACSTALNLQLLHLEEPVDAAGFSPVNIDLGPSASASATLTFTAPQDDFQGYLVRISSQNSSANAVVSVDVSSSATRFPRYGFLSSFPPGQSQDTSRSIVQTLAQNFHLNLLQFYDWAWRHEKLIERSSNGSIVDPWTDLFGRANSVATIQDLIGAAHDQNVLALGYTAVYAAREGYEQLWGLPVSYGLFTGPDAKTQVIQRYGPGIFLFLFDPSNSGWQNWMLNEYISAIDLGFDGVQLDQFGPEPPVYRADGTLFDLPAAFVSFLRAIKPGLVAHNPARALCAFNIVDGAVDAPAAQPVATSNTCDFIYSELWYGTNSYEDIRKYVNFLRQIDGGRPVVFAGYSNYGEDVGVRLQAEDATLTGGTYVANNHEGYSGTGFVAGFDKQGGGIKWSGSLSEASTVSLVFRYANATRIDARRTVYVDDAPVGKVTMSARPEWTDWSSDAWVQVQQSAGPHTVELRYDPGDVGAVNIDRMTFSQFNEPSVRLENASMFASGATHIELGDNVQVLGNEYFPNRSKSVSPSLVVALQRQYDFITAYENALFDQDVIAHDERRNDIVVTSGQRIVQMGAGGIWSTVGEKGPYEVINLINLIGVDDDQWRNVAPTPQTQNDIAIRYYGPRVAQNTTAYYASPDGDTNELHSLPLTLGSDARGAYVEFVVPRLAYWDLVLLR